MSSIALLTDFGTRDWFVGTMKGVIGSINPDIATVDITHDIAPGDIRGGAFALRSSFSFFPKNTIFVCVVDPGVGGLRVPVAVKTKDYLFIAPDNGLLSFALTGQKHKRIRKIGHKKYMLKDTSKTFHGRDIFAPAAAYLSMGVPFSSIGKLMNRMVELPWPDVVVKKGSITGEVVYIDRFGNLITNIPNAEVRPYYESRATACFKRATQIPLRSFYGQVPAGKPLAVQGSSGLLEISINGGDAAEVLNAGIGDSVIIK